MHDILSTMVIKHEGLSYQHYALYITDCIVGLSPMSHKHAHTLIHRGSHTHTHMHTHAHTPKCMHRAREKNRVKTAEQAGMAKKQINVLLNP